MGERRVRPRAVRAEVEHVQGHARPRPPLAHPRRRGARLVRQQRAGHVAGVRVTDDDVGRPGGAVGQPDPGHAAALDEDPLDLGAQFDAAAQPFQEAAEGSHDRGGAPDRVVHAPAQLELHQEGEQGRGPRRVTPDQQGVEGQRPAEERVPHRAVHEVAHAQHRAVLQQVGQHPQHRGQRHHRAFRVRVEGVEDRGDAGLQALVARHVRGAEAGDLGEHRRLVGPEVEGGAVVVEHAVVRVEGHERDVVGEPLAGQREELLEEVRGGEDGGAGVEAEAVEDPLGGAAPELVPPLQHRDVVARAGEPDGRGEAAASAAHHDDTGGGHGREVVTWGSTCSG